MNPKCNDFALTEIERTHVLNEPAIQSAAPGRIGTNNSISRNWRIESGYILYTYCGCMILYMSCAIIIYMHAKLDCLLASKQPQTYLFVNRASGRQPLGILAAKLCHPLGSIMALIMHIHIGISHKAHIQ